MGEVTDWAVPGKFVAQSEPRRREHAHEFTLFSLIGFGSELWTEARLALGLTKGQPSEHEELYCVGSIARQVKCKEPTHPCSESSCTSQSNRKESLIRVL